MVYSMNDQLDELQEMHYRRQLMQKPCINKVKHLLLYLMTSCYCSANYNRLVSVSHVTALFIKLFKSTLYGCKLFKYYFYRHLVLAAPVTCGRHMAREPCCDHPCSIVIFTTYIKQETFNSPVPWVQPVLGPVPCSEGICHESLAGLLGSTTEVAPCLSPSWHCASSTADSCRLAG